MKQPRNTLSILYYLKRGHLNRNGECPVMCRISVRGEKETFSSHVYTSPDNWDVKSARVIGRTAKVIEQNKILTDLQVTLTRHYYDIEQRNGYVTAEMIKNAYMGVTAKAESLLPIYKEFLEETEALIGIQKSKKTYEKYERCYRRVVEFLRDKYHVSDIAFRDLKPMFLVDFEVWLATKKNCSTNTIYKFLQLLRMPVLKAKRMGIVFKDPYEGYKMKKVSVDRGYLTEEEVIAIATHEITIPRLEQVRDIFIFCCYTGLAYSDVAALRQGNIQKMFDGRLWIVTHRQKTKTNVNVPLLPMAKKILEKYNWNLELAGEMLREYHKIRPISAEEWKNLRVRFTYPEKYWKLANYYYSHKKVWISEKNVEKLQNLIRQREIWENFAEECFRDYPQ